MARYSVEELLHLRQSPLAVKPPGLPPAEEWMGPPPETPRKQPATRATNEAGLLDQTNRRPGTERHRSANPEDIILGPPKTSFASASSVRNAGRTFDSPDRPSLNRDNESRDRFNFRRNDGDADRLRDNRTRFKRGDGEDESGWSTVKPRKSFGADGAERFNNGRMGGERNRNDIPGHNDNHRHAMKPKERDERDGKERHHRGFDSFSLSKDKETLPDDNRKRDMGRARNESSWFRDAEAPTATPRDRNSNGDRLVDRTRGWRERVERDERERPTERQSDRRWDRERNDQRQEQDPEWMDEPADEKFTAHTADDFQKWKERMKANHSGTPAADGGRPSEKTVVEESFFALEKTSTTVESAPLLLESGPDRFFTTFGKASVGIDEAPKETAARPAFTSKSSRFTSFFSAPQEEPRLAPEPQLPPVSGLAALFQASKPKDAPVEDENAEERKAFAQILQKLQSQSIGGSTSAPPTKIAIHPRPAQEQQPASPPAAPEIIHAYRTERPEEPRPMARPSHQQAMHDMIHRQNAPSQPSSEQMINDLVNHRQNALSQGSSRPEQNQTKVDFLMGLMQNTLPPNMPRLDQMGMRMPPPMPHMDEREQEILQDNRASRDAQRSRPLDGPPGFLDEAAFLRGPQQPQLQQQGPPPLDSNGRPQPQPTQILQRPPPGLEQGPPGWAGPGNQMPPQQRHIQPPPGLANRGMPPMQQLFPPGFPGPMPGFPPPEAMQGMPRNMQPPPPGFFPPPGFMPPFGPPDAMAYAPFDGRGAPPQGNFRRQ